jgi:hypothetical protein
MSCQQNSSNNKGKETKRMIGRGRGKDEIWSLEHCIPLRQISPYGPHANLIPSPRSSSVPCSHERDVTYQINPREPNAIQRKHGMWQGGKQANSHHYST